MPQAVSSPSQVTVPCERPKPVCKEGILWKMVLKHGVVVGLRNLLSGVQQCPYCTGDAALLELYNQPRANPVPDESFVVFRTLLGVLLEATACHHLNWGIILLQLRKRVSVLRFLPSI